MLSKPLAILFALDRVSVRWARNGRCYNSLVIRMPPIGKCQQRRTRGRGEGVGRQPGLGGEECVQQLIRGSHSEHAASLMNRCREMSRMLPAHGHGPRASLLTRCVHSCTLPPEHCWGHRGLGCGLSSSCAARCWGCCCWMGCQPVRCLASIPVLGRPQAPAAAPVNQWQLITNPDPLVPGGAHGDKRSSARS